ncbi:hypothetical protein DMC30DRAFT_388957 [Rhodotorula diobovata]|uniref:Uncharacterized protein n=1 Tax=Rhodotorula diobovata TaxID=5288 RepID=A0A5C5FSM6_9BASI|nr:hypothetical protein DMC30DRAFT_399370 [Rhodotorula diobovata]TNY23813.1 hypothetical protein DMC30DRAFT_388957 [Rhodotorula diobovata]
MLATTSSSPRQLRSTPPLARFISSTPPHLDDLQLECAQLLTPPSGGFSRALRRPDPPEHPMARSTRPRIPSTRRDPPRARPRGALWCRAAPGCRAEAREGHLRARVKGTEGPQQPSPSAAGVSRVPLWSTRARWTQICAGTSPRREGGFANGRREGRSSADCVARVSRDAGRRRSGSASRAALLLLPRTVHDTVARRYGRDADGVTHERNASR